MSVAINHDLIQKYQDVASSDVLSSIKQASQETGVDFAYLLEQAQAESSFDVDAKAKTSSATGLYQFIDQTWLHVINKHGEDYGLEHLSDQITRENGRLVVSDKATRDEILELRNDPEISSYMAAELAKSNESYLKHHVKGLDDAGSTDLYLAHFMGAGGAARFLNALEQNPDAEAASIFKKEARANHNVFFEKDGTARSLQDVYAFFDNKFSPSNDLPQQIPVAKESFNVASSTQIDNDLALEAIETLYARPLSTANVTAHHNNVLHDTGYFSSPLSSETLFMIEEFVSQLHEKTAFL